MTRQYICLSKNCAENNNTFLVAKTVLYFHLSSVYGENYVSKKNVYGLEYLFHLLYLVVYVIYCSNHGINKLMEMVSHGFGTKAAVAKDNKVFIGYNYVRSVFTVRSRDIVFSG